MNVSFGCWVIVLRSQEIGYESIYKIKCVYQKIKMPSSLMCEQYGLLMHKVLYFV